MVGKETRPPKRRTGLFIGACGGTVAAASPEMRFDWRISEASAERTEHRPLTLMNSARTARAAAIGPRARTRYTAPQGVHENEEEGIRPGRSPPRRAGRSGEVDSPQDPRVSNPDCRCRLASSGRV